MEQPRDIVLEELERTEVLYDGSKHFTALGVGLGRQPVVDPISLAARLDNAGSAQMPKCRDAFGCESCSAASTWQVHSSPCESSATMRSRVSSPSARQSCITGFTFRPAT